MNKYFVVFTVAIIVRLVLAVLFINIFPEWPTGSSIGFRIGLAEGILSGEGFSYNGIPNLYQTPAYPFFLAVIFAILGNHWWSIALFQSILGGISSAAISKIGSRFSEKGWLAGLVYAFYPYAAMQSRSIVDTSLFVMLFVIAIYYYLKFMDKHQIYDLILASILASLGILNRPSIAVIPLAFVCHMILRRYSWKSILYYTLVSFLIAVSVPFLWVIRNYHLTKHFPVLAVGGQHFMWHAHNEHIYNVLERKESPDLIGSDPRYPMIPCIKVSDFFKIDPTEQVELSKLCSQSVRSWLSNHKYEVLKYSLLKLKLFLMWEYVPGAIGHSHQSLRLLIYKITNAPVTILGWLGVMILLLKRNKFGYFIACVAIGFVMIHVISIVTSRHKIPLDALFITLMPLAVYYLYSTTKNLSKRIAKALHYLP